MNARIRVDGIYDQRTILSLQDADVQDLGFDFRPTSFNFLQQHVFLELVKIAPSADLRCFLRYENEQDFVIQKMLDDLKISTDASNGSLLSMNNMLLEFSDNRPAEFYDKFETPFYWHYQADASIKSILDCTHLKGLVLNYNFLEQIHEQGQFSNFVQNFFQLTYKKVEEKSLEVILAVDWDANIFPSLFDFIDFDSLALPINNKIEVCYRNVDLGKVKEGLGHYRNLEI